jgi:hypothetical protein
MGKVSPNAKKGTRATCKRCDQTIESIGHGMWKLASAPGTSGQLCTSHWAGNHKPR